MLAPKTVKPGDIHWLRKKDDIYPREVRASLRHIHEGIFDHPVLLVSVDHDGESVFACVITSLRGMSFDDYHYGRHSIRKIHFPIHPAPPHPDSGIILNLQEGAALLDKFSYIKAGASNILRLPRLALDGSHTIKANQRLDGASLDLLRTAAWGTMAPPLYLPPVRLLYMPPSSPPEAHEEPACSSSALSSPSPPPSPHSAHSPTNTSTTTSISKTSQPWRRTTSPSQLTDGNWRQARTESWLGAKRTSRMEDGDGSWRRRSPSTSSTSSTSSSNDSSNDSNTTLSSSPPTSEDESDLSAPRRLLFPHANS